MISEAYISADEVIAELGVSRYFLLRLEADGLVKSQRSGRRRFYRRSEIQKCLAEEQKQKACTKTLSMAVSEELYDFVNRLSLRSNQPISTWVRRILIKHIETEEIAELEALEQLPIEFQPPEPLAPVQPTMSLEEMRQLQETLAGLIQAQTR